MFVHNFCKPLRLLYWNHWKPEKNKKIYLSLIFANLFTITSTIMLLHCITIKKIKLPKEKKIFVLTCFWAKFFIKYFTFTPRLEQLACPNLSFNAIDIHLDTQKGSHKVSFLCWYLCFFSQSPEVVNFQGVSLCHFAKKSCIRTLNSIIETKLGQNFAQK